MKEQKDYISPLNSVDFKIASSSQDFFSNFNAFVDTKQEAPVAKKSPVVNGSFIYNGTTSSSIKKESHVPNNPWAIVSKQWKLDHLERIFGPAGFSREAILDLLYPKVLFGKTCWENYFGDLEDVPPLPENIVEILKEPCPFWPEKRVGDTHVLTLIPHQVAGRSMDYEGLQELVKAPKKGERNTQVSYCSSSLEEHLKQENLGFSQSFWVLMTKEPIPRSSEKAYYEQSILLSQMIHKSKRAYTYPKFLEVLTASMMHYIHTGNYICPEVPQNPASLVSFTRCLDTVFSQVYGHQPVVVGCYDHNGILLASDGTAPASCYGVIALCRLGGPLSDPSQALDFLLCDVFQEFENVLREMQSSLSFFSNYHQEVASKNYKSKCRDLKYKLDLFFKDMELSFVDPSVSLLQLVRKLMHEFSKDLSFFKESLGQILEKFKFLLRTLEVLLEKKI